MTEAAVELRADEWRSQLDARRGIVRIHPEVMHALGVKPWSAVLIKGSRSTGALAAISALDSDRSAILMDNLTSRNAGAAPGDRVVVGKAALRPAQSISLSGTASPAPLDPSALRLALLGKVMARGDHISLLPQDFVGRTDQSGVDLIAALRQGFGEGWKEIELVVDATEPAGLVGVSMETVVVFGGAGTSSSATPLAVGDAAPSAADLPGLESQLQTLTELFEIGLYRGDLLARLGTRANMGVLITGPPGSGKGALVEAVAGALGLRLVRVWGPALARIEPNAAAAHLDAVVAQVRTGPPTVLLVEDVDGLVPQEGAGPLASLVVERVGTLVGEGRVAVACTTSHPERLAPELRRPGVIDHEVEIPLPRRDQRLKMLQAQTRSLAVSAGVSLDEVAARTPGFVAADLAALCREAALRAAHRAAGDPGSLPAVSQEDFSSALDVVRPSSMAGAAVEIGEIRLADVGDMEATKTELEEAIIWPLKYPDTFERLGVDPVSGVLLFGPPGCGKTFLIKALAHEAEANFIAVKGAELLTKWVGESERAVRELFRRARGAAPCLVFFDEIDSLAPARGGGAQDTSTTDRVVAQLLTELDGVEDLKEVFVVGATNRPELVDPALVRPGRLERLIYVAPPDPTARSAILKAAAKRIPLSDDVDLDAIASACENYSAADLDAVARRAAIIAMREDINAPAVTARHFEEATSEVGPSLQPDQVRALEAFAASRR